MPDASPRSVVARPVSWEVNQSWGSNTAPSRSKVGRSQRRSHRSFVMVVAAAEVVVGLAIIVSIYKTRRSTSVDNANLLNQ